MKIVVTGSTGFVGKHLIASLMQNNVNIITIERTGHTDQAYKQIALTNPAQISFDEFPTGDVFIHLGGMADSNAKATPGEYSKINTEWPNQMAEFASQKNYSQFIFLSSAKVHGDYCDRAITSDLAFNPGSHYAESKCNAEILLNKLETEMGIAILRPPAIYGLPLKGGNKKIVTAIQNNKPIPFSTTDNKRSFIDASNLVSALSSCIDKPVQGNHSYALHEHQTISTNEYISLIAQSLNIPLRSISLPKHLLSTIDMLGKHTIKKEPLAALHRNFYIECDKFSNTYSWKPEHNTETGLLMMCQSLKNQISKQ